MEREKIGLTKDLGDGTGKMILSKISNKEKMILEEVPDNNGIVLEFVGNLGICNVLIKVCQIMKRLAFIVN